MNTEAQSLKAIVQEKYGQIAENEEINASCGASCGCGIIDEVKMAEGYDQLKGYVQEADLGLGCGLPTAFAKIKSGDTVVDLGSGAGNDAFVARAEVGPDGKVIGIDFTEQMISRARANAEKRGLNNVEFRFGDIEKIPVTSNAADVVVSNCVFNLIPNKKKAFEETYRILKQGGHFSISDIVLRGDLPDGLRKSAEMYAGCVSGAIDKNEYLKLIEDAGFKNITLQKQKKIDLPEAVLTKFLSENDIARYQNGDIGIFSITVYGEKQNDTNCCADGKC